MREFAFDLVFDRGVDPLADLFIRTTALQARSLAAPAESWFWRVDRVTGPAESLAAVEELRATEPPVGYAAGRPEVAETHHDCLERGAGRRVFYSYVADSRGHTVPGLVAEHLDPGVIVEMSRDDDSQHWRLLVRGDSTVGSFHDALLERLRDGVSFRMGYLRDVTRWDGHAEAGSMPVEQRRALRAAVEAGYYESPRAVTLDELADEVGVPRSTFSYRLRNAEAGLARAYVGTASRTDDDRP